MIKTLISFLILLLAFTSKAQQEFSLYETIPNHKPTGAAAPTLTMYKPVFADSQRVAVIICPGGGYRMLALKHEGADVALALNEFGITAFVLKYRLPHDSIMQDKSIGPMQDIQRAFQTVREHAAEWNINPSKIGVMGFSAGGHLAATASTQFNREVIDNPKHISLRPDFSILIYPVISFSDSLAHKGSRDNLLGKNASAEIIKQYSNELQVTAQTPPAFLVHTADDKTVPVGNSISYYQALLRNGVLSEMLLYPRGGHGFGMNNKTTADKWINNLKSWLIAGKFL